MQRKHTTCNASTANVCPLDPSHTPLYAAETGSCGKIHAIDFHDNSIR